MYLESSPTWSSSMSQPGKTYPTCFLNMQPPEIVFALKSLLNLHSGTKESLCLPNHHLTLFSKMCSSATGTPHAVKLRREGWREVGLASTCFWFCSIRIARVFYYFSMSLLIYALSDWRKLRHE